MSELVVRGGRNLPKKRKDIETEKNHTSFLYSFYEPNIDPISKLLDSSGI